MHRAIDRFWFSPRTAGTLGFCRFLLFVLLLWFYGTADYATWGSLPMSMQNRPLPAFRMLGIPIASHDMLLIWQFVWKVSLVTSCIGLLTRVSCWVSLITSFYLFGVPGNFGKMGHGEGILVLTMLILALSKCGDAWSVDVLRRAWRTNDPRPASAKPASGEYTWPIKMVWLLMSLIFLAAGVTKLRMSGLDWIRTDNLSTMILQHHYGGYGDPPNSFGVWIAEHKSLCKVIAGLTILIEVAFPLVMFSRIARITLVPAMFLAQVGIYMMMGVSFTQFMFVYIFWVPWDCIGDRLRQIAQRSGRYSMLYDGGCGICRSIASVGTRLDVLERVEFVDVVNDWAEVKRRWPALDQAKCLIDIHVIAPRGDVLTRFKGYRAVAWAIPATWPLLPFLYLPPVAWIGDRIYGYIAAHRHDAGCEIQPTITGGDVDRDDRC